MDNGQLTSQILKERKFWWWITANCGYTGQYAELQSLHEKLGKKLTILAFPANDFAEQEKGMTKDISTIPR